MDQILAEDKRYKVYSISENVYLIDKEHRNKDDQNIASVYGDPDSALISKDQKYIVVAGHGINIWYLDTDKPKKGLEILTDPDNQMWTKALHQDIVADKSWDFFRFVSYDENNKTRVFRMNVHTLTVSKIE